MLLPTTPLSLIASSILLCAGVVDCMTVKRGEIVKKPTVPANATTIYFDSSTHELVFGLPPSLSKRESDTDRLLALIRSHEPHRFCKEFCPDEYSHQPPIIVYTTAKKCTTVQKTVTTTLKPKTTTKGVTETPNLGSTVTIVSTIQDFTTSTVEASPLTIDVQITSIISEYETLTTAAATQTVTELAAFTSTIVETLTGAQVTSTVAVHVAAVQPRHGNPPSWLRGHSGPHIVDACKKIVQPPPRQTITRTITKSETHTKLHTVTIPGNLVTLTSTTHSPASTVTKELTTTVVSSFLTTHTPVITETLITLTTEKFTSIETITPLPVTTSTTLLTSTTVTTTAPGATHTVCQNAVYGIAGGGVTDPQEILINGAATSLVGCCAECYDTQSCTGWIFYGSYGCFLGSIISGRDTSSTCPNGLGSFEVYGGDMGDNYAGGPGPCTSNFVATPFS